MTRLGLLLTLIIVTRSLALAAQSVSPRFEVASIKPSGGQGFGNEIRFLPGGTLRVVDKQLKGIIAEAYDIGLTPWRASLSPFVLVGGPNAVLLRSFTIDAKASSDADPAQMRAMLRTLLADRFKLRIRREVRKIPLYVLTVTPQGVGPQLKRSDVDCVGLIFSGQMKNASLEVKTKCAGGMMAGGAGNATFAGPISQLVRFAQPFLDRPLIDETGLRGNFEWSIEFRDELSNIDRLTMFDAFRRDLGLRIEPRTGPYEVLVIESVEMPTPN